MRQTSRVLHHLLTHETLDPMTAWNQLGVYRLADVVYKLKKEGWDIQTVRKKVKNRYGEDCSVANYKIVIDGEAK